VAAVGETVAVSVTLVPEVGVVEEAANEVVLAVVPVEEESTVTVTELEDEAV
jgi:hypothetical protein